MKYGRLTVMGAGLLSGVLCLSVAQAETEFERKWYLGLGVGISNLDPDVGGTPYHVDDKRDLGGKLFLGYDINERFSLEGYYSHLGKAKIAPSGSVKYADFGFSGLYYFYKQDFPHVGWEGFGRLGLGRMRNDSNLNYTRVNDSHVMLGAGVEYGFENGFAVRADVDFYDEDARLLAINLLKRFGGSKQQKIIIAPATMHDSDRDGVVDSRDRCPATPADTSVDDSGCERDSDGDGVTDSNDLCPETPTGAEVDVRGCEKDMDNDGIVDRVDRCSATPSGVKVDAQGCELKTAFVLNGVTFATASAELIGDSRRMLDEVRDTLQLHPEIKVEVAGYTDSRGSRKYNVGLSQRRAEAVLDYLVGQGISADRLTAKGYGPDKPIADNATSAGRAVNRRVEMHILN
jgi:OOP family OmpA-OmpF porin